MRLDGNRDMVLLQRLLQRSFLDFRQCCVEDLGNVGHTLRIELDDCLFLQAVTACQHGLLSAVVIEVGREDSGVDLPVSVFFHQSGRQSHNKAPVDAVLGQDPELHWGGGVESKDLLTKCV